MNMDQLGKIVRLVNDTLAPQALGAYLHGSAVQGGLRPASDIDVLVVAEHSLTDRERRVLTDELLRISGAGPQTRSLELTVVLQSQVRPWRTHLSQTSCTATGYATK